MTSAALPGHDPSTSGCTDFVVGADVGELAPGHRLVVRGVCLDIDERLWLHYAWTPGLTEPMGEDSGIWLAVEYCADSRRELAGRHGFAEYPLGPGGDGRKRHANLILLRDAKDPACH